MSGFQPVWTVEAVCKWSEGTKTIDQMELPAWANDDNFPSDTVAKMAGQLASAKQTARLLLRAVTGPYVRIKLQGEVGTPTGGTSRMQSADYVLALVSQHGAQVVSHAELRCR